MHCRSTHSGQPGKNKNENRNENFIGWEHLQHAWATSVPYRFPGGQHTILGAPLGWGAVRNTSETNCIITNWPFIIFQVSPTIFITRSTELETRAYLGMSMIRDPGPWDNLPEEGPLGNEALSASAAAAETGLPPTLRWSELWSRPAELWEAGAEQSPTPGHASSLRVRVHEGEGGKLKAILPRASEKVGVPNWRAQEGPVCYGKCLVL